MRVWLPTITGIITLSAFLVLSYLWLGQAPTKRSTSLAQAAMLYGTPRPLSSEAFQQLTGEILESGQAYQLGGADRWVVCVFEDDQLVQFYRREPDGPPQASRAP
jgi:hypothetical protein